VQRKKETLLPIGVYDYEKQEPGSYLTAPESFSFLYWFWNQKGQDNIIFVDSLTNVSLCDTEGQYGYLPSYPSKSHLDKEKPHYTSSIPFKHPMFFIPYLSSLLRYIHAFSFLQIQYLFCCAHLFSHHC